MPQEYTVVVLAGGRGQKLTPLSESVPKCLLPIANRPLISYPIEFLEKSKFTGNFIANPKLFLTLYFSFF